MPARSVELHDSIYYMDVIVEVIVDEIRKQYTICNVIMLLFFGNNTFFL